jgi:IS1 family transposase
MEGASVRSTCRILRLGQSTLLTLLLQAGQGCEQFLNDMIVGVPCNSVQCDELWSFVYCKERTRERHGWNEDEIGDCYTWTAIDSCTKLMLTYAVGKRDNATAMEFVTRLRRATCGDFQIDTDGLGIYRSVIPLAFGRFQDHAQVIKIFGASVEGEARYSPAQIVDIHVQVGSGNPDLETANTSFIERSNLTIRMMLRRFTRLTNAHSKSWRHHEAALGLLFAYYNFCRPHETLRTEERRKRTPAMPAGVVDHIWSARQLVERAIPDDTPAVA